MESAAARTQAGELRLALLCLWRDLAPLHPVMPHLRISSEQWLVPGSNGHQPDGCIVKQIGDDWWAVWPAHDLTLCFSRIHESRESVTADVKVTSTTVAGFDVGLNRINLVALTNVGRQGLAKRLDGALPGLPWPWIMDRSCQRVIQEIRTVPPPEELVPERHKPGRFLVDLWIPMNQITVMFGGGGSGKSYLALAVAVHGVLGHPLGPWQIGPIKRAMYLDWETDRETHNARLWGLTDSIESFPSGSILYRRRVRPLTEEISAYRADVAREGIDFLVVDSLGAASGPEPEGADAALRTLQAVRSLNVTAVVVAHVSHANLAHNGTRHPYGSVYVENTARSNIDVRSNPTADGMVMTLLHGKRNHKQAKPVGMQFTFDEEERVTIQRAKPESEHLGAIAQTLDAMDALPRGEKTVSRIANTLGEKPASVKTRLYKMVRNGLVVQLESVSGGRGKESQYERASTRQE